MSSSKRIRGVIRWKIDVINTISPYYDTYANTRSDTKRQTEENDAIRAFLNSFNGGEGDDRNQLIIKGDPLIKIDHIPTTPQKIYEIVLKECVFDDEFNIHFINCDYLHFRQCKQLNKMEGVNDTITKLNIHHSYMPIVHNPASSGSPTLKRISFRCFFDIVTEISVKTSSISNAFSIRNASSYFGSIISNVSIPINSLYLSRYSCDNTLSELYVLCVFFDQLSLV